MKKIPVKFMMTLLAVCLVSIGFSSWVFGAGQSQFHVDVSSSDVLDLGGVFKTNNSYGNNGTGIEGIQANEQGGLVGDETIGDKSYFKIHSILDINKCKKDVPNFLNSKEITFSIELSYANPNVAKRNFEYLSNTCMTGFTLTGSYNKNDDSLNDSTNPIAISYSALDYTISNNPKVTITLSQIDLSKTELYFCACYNVTIPGVTKALISEDRNSGASIFRVSMNFLIN